MPIVLYFYTIKTKYMNYTTKKKKLVNCATEGRIIFVYFYFLNIVYLKPQYINNIPFVLIKLPTFTSTWCTVS